MPNQQSIQSLGRAFDILEFLSSNGEAGITEISKSVNLSKGTVHRMLFTLTELGYTEKNQNDKYFLTFKFLKLASSMLKFSSMLSYTRPFLVDLSKKSGETVHFVKREGTNIIYIDKVQSNENSLQMVSRIGLTHPLYCTGVGKAILANMPNEKIKNIWEKSKILPKTSKTITDFNLFLKEIEDIRVLGYSIDDEENEEGIKCIAASVKDEFEHLDYAFSISAPVSRMTDERINELSKLVLETKNKF